jgi:hypothetical protein
MARSVKSEPQEIDVIQLDRGQLNYWFVSESAFFCNRMAAKAKRSLLLPSGPMTKTQKATKLKHAPYAEYRDSPYVRQGAGETLFEMIGSAPKMSIASAALRMPTTVSKTEIKQLVRCPAERVSLWGIPRLDMSVVRMAGISRTPDIRTRAKIDRWAMRVPIQWVEPMLNAKKVTQLVISAGFICGLGDWRIEKGGEYGGFRLAEPDDPELLDIIKEGGYLAQEEALRNPICANAETEELMAWYLDELARRGVNPEDERPEDVEADAGEFVFGAGDERLTAPGAATASLSVQENGEDFHP